MRLLRSVIAYNLANLLHRLVLPLAPRPACAALYPPAGRDPLAESHLTRRLFGQILRRVERLTWHPT